MHTVVPFIDMHYISGIYAYERMIQHALQVGANAVVGVRYDATEITPGVTEVLCYGTAVVVQPVQ